MSFLRLDSVHISREKVYFSGPDIPRSIYLQSILRCPLSIIGFVNDPRDIELPNLLPDLKILAARPLISKDINPTNPGFEFVYFAGGHLYRYDTNRLTLSFQNLGSLYKQLRRDTLITYRTLDSVNINPISTAHRLAYYYKQPITDELSCKEAIPIPESTKLLLASLYSSELDKSIFLPANKPRRKPTAAENTFVSSECKSTFASAKKLLQIQISHTDHIIKSLMKVYEQLIHVIESSPVLNVSAISNRSLQPLSYVNSFYDWYVHTILINDQKINSTIFNRLEHCDPSDFAIRDGLNSIQVLCRHRFGLPPQNETTHFLYHHDGVVYKYDTDSLDDRYALAMGSSNDFSDDKITMMSNYYALTNLVSTADQAILDL